MRQTLLLLMGATISLSACVTGDETPEAAPSVDRWEDFKAAAILVPGTTDRYIFGGDMVAVGEAGLRREYERYFGGGTSQPGIGELASALSIDNVGGVDNTLGERYGDSNGGRYALTYCIQRGTFTASQLTAIEPALTAAQQSWSGLVNIQFVHDASQDATCSASNTSVFFNVRGVSSGAFFGSSFFPDYARSTRELLIDASAFTTTAGGRDLEGIMRHESGHILGFRHEHVWIACTSETPDDARHITAYDVNSIMHYPQCRPSGTGGYRQTELDYQGSIELYGMSPSLLAAIQD